MASPVVPNEIKELIPTPGGSFCEKFIKSLKLPFLIWKIYSFFVGEDGKLTPEGAALFCSLNCKGTSGGNVPGTPTVTASDGTFLDKIRITWTTIAGSSSYEVFRNTTNSTSTAILIGSSAGTSLDDSAVSPGVTYYYWVRAKTGSIAGAFSAVDTGFAATQLGAVSDLDVSRGFSRYIAPRISLVWTPVTGATSWDIYRSTDADFATATRIDSDRVVFDNSEVNSNGPNPAFLDNGGEYVYFDTPPDAWTVYNYWVVPKATGALGAESNMGTGFASGFGDGDPANEAIIQYGISSVDISPGAVEARVTFFGAGGNGAGSGPVHGGGGGGGGATVYGYLVIAGPTPKFRISGAAIPARSTSETNGTVVPLSTLDYAPDGSTWGTIATSNAGSVAATYSSTDNGVGGDGVSGTSSGLTVDGVKDGRPGKAANGNKGGRSGYGFGQLSGQGAHFPGSSGSGIYGYNGDAQGSGGNSAGSGAYANSLGAPARDGGRGAPGFAIVWWR